MISGAPDPIAGADTPEAEEGESEEQRWRSTKRPPCRSPCFQRIHATVLPLYRREEHADDEADDDEEDDAHAEESQRLNLDNHADRSHRGTMAKELAMLAVQRRRPATDPGTNRGVREGRAGLTAAQAQRFGEFELTAAACAHREMRRSAATRPSPKTSRVSCRRESLRRQSSNNRRGRSATGKDR